MIKAGEPKKSEDERQLLALLKINASFFWPEEGQSLSLLPPPEEEIAPKRWGERVNYTENKQHCNFNSDRPRSPARGGPGSTKYWFLSCFPTLDHRLAEHTWSIRSNQFTAELQAVLIFMAALYFSCVLHRPFTPLNLHCMVKQHTP